MKLNQLKSLLRDSPSTYVRFTLPDGDRIPAHFHVTEVGHVTKRFIDCGGKLHDPADTCVLQTHVGEDVDHRLTASTLAKILDLGARILPHDELPVEVEYDYCVVSQYPIESASHSGEFMDLHLGEKHTDCLAKQRCGSGETSCSTGASRPSELAGCC